ncbi:coagulation factor IXb isoform X1 [Periophthalmus magnuspinnatus]|uniref:coagulation factor IXb isoform X1 n=1 Tax=Periophthalmus magnuspinnatus TaxID=409849 RepID=UPI00145BFC82|nr:coagulation factor IXb isoform X1 [Periophthalmus magnuspinnatus]
MATLCLQLFVAGLLLDLCVIGAELTPTNTESVFTSQQSANAVLSRPRRYNSGLEEVLKKDNLERECKEEQCTMEEARECFENDEKTLEFWAGYADGDQCNPPPCQNGGVCQDGVNSYTCWCQSSFSGKNCEIELAQQCSVDNGGCSHFCGLKEQQVVCFCAPGYELGPDHKTCTPTGPFSCGRVNIDSGTKSRSLLTPRTSNSDQRNSSLDYSGFDFNLTMFYEYYETGDEDSSYVPEGSTVDVPSDYQGDQAMIFDEVEEGNMNITDNITLWYGPKLRNRTRKGNSDHRIVGGDEATPGQIPWQVALMDRRQGGDRALPFCGASLLSDVWVITAAHCLIEKDGITIRNDFFVRVGEHDVHKDEGHERDHSVSVKYIYPNYNYKDSPYDHDLALLRLSEPVQLSDHRLPICLGPKHFLETIVQESSPSLVSGWGRLRFQGPESPTLQKLVVPYVERTTCKESSRERITRQMFCAGYTSLQKDSCQGDSGGPHATKYKGTWFLTGIVSWGEECARDGKYGVYTRVSHYYIWIARRIGMKARNRKV